MFVLSKYSLLTLPKMRLLSLGVHDLHEPKLFADDY